jgi:hypothetical protein
VSEPPLRILHAPTNVGGNPWGLSRAERRLGHHSDVMVFDNDWLHYPADINLNLKRHTRLIKTAVKLRFFLWALPRYDVFVFNFGRTILDFWRVGLHCIDLPILRRHGKAIVMIYQGADARQNWFVRQHYRFGHEAVVEGKDRDRRKATRIATVARYAHRIFSLNPDLIPVLPLGTAFLPYTVASYDECHARRLTAPATGPVRIAHAPTDRLVKGTDYVVAACERLQAAGAAVTLVLVERVPHTEALRLFASCHLAVDQLMIGWYGAFAVEVMAMGLPVVCYVRNADLDAVPGELRADLPVVSAEPWVLGDVLNELVRDVPKRKALGERSRAYVERWHDPIEIARRMTAVYREILANAPSRRGVE